ncbi:MAG: pseudouridine synthase [Pseudomonadota bacterium]
MTEALKILWEDEDILFIDKPAGLLSVPGKTEPDCVEARLRELHPEALTVHRLDMATSGVMVFARNKAAQRHLGLQFERRHLAKTYIAVVDGVVDGDSGHIDLPLRADWPNRPLQMVCHEQGRPSQTDWKVLERFEDRTRLELTPLTGRSHQLRVHLLAIGHPILGDEFYAEGEALAASPRLLLHAHRLSLFKPTGGDRITVESDVPF